MNRVVVTGLGIVSSLALDREGTWSAMLEGKDGLAPLPRLSLPLEPAQLAGQVAMDPGRHQTLCERMALRALEEALEGFQPMGDPERIGVFQGAGTSGLPVAEAFLEERLAGRRGRPSGRPGNAWRPANWTWPWPGAPRASAAPPTPASPASRPWTRRGAVPSAATGRA